MKKTKVFLVLALTTFAFFACFRLTEIPPTWMDEGVISQVAAMVATDGYYGYQMAPGQLINAAFLTTSYPLIFPLALIFKLAGVGLLQARLVMVFYLLVLISSGYYLIRRQFEREEGKLWALAAIWLLITFAPLYGHGKNVLGEVPGLAWLFAGLYFFSRWEKGDRAWAVLALTGLSFGFAMATKPIYLFLSAPVLAIIIFGLGWKKFFWRERIILFGSSALPLVWWWVVHFSGQSVADALTAGNPDHVSFFSLLWDNGRRLLTEFQPLYAVALVGVWIGSIGWRFRRKQDISLVELTAASIAVLNLVSYLTTRGFYRYFFPAQVLALAFLPGILLALVNRRRIVLGILILLVAGQLYQTTFHSWLSQSWTSRRTAELKTSIGELPVGKSVLFYNVPEATTFIPHRNYYQYFRFSDAVQRGEANLDLIRVAAFDTIIIDEKFLPLVPDLARHYHRERKIDKYLLYEKI